MRRLAWIGAFSFASGFPFGLVNDALPVYIRSQGASLAAVGDLSLASLPWTFKFLWAPLVDRFGTRRSWIVVVLALLGAALYALRALPVLPPSVLLLPLVTLVVALSATQDIAIDAYTIEATTREELGVANSVRIAIYRAAMLVSAGGVTWWAGRHGWPAAWTAAAAVFGALAVAGLFAPVTSRAGLASEPLWQPIAAFLARRDVWLIVAFALLFKLDIAALDPMTKPFWVDRGLSLEAIGTTITTGRLVATVLGATLGGVLTSRWGLFPSLWRLGAVQALSSLGYAAAAAAAPSLPLILAAAFFENFAAGLGTAVFLAFLMSVCEKRYAATQYAVLSALLALSRSGAGWASGRVAEQTGYTTYFVLTFLIGLPAFLLLPLLRRSLDGAAPAAGGAA